ncbi:syntaxin-like protein psy1 [Lasiosphaeria ovina]|uniref:Syntaxin-like protein psy1 n=1 Tax=Lasiosphaeria ovina TaxID=92902 RepID=A0AAE0K4K4_9PEZI|nr:syntaxin-like protein psy1 [Lasiosphaeria ovina]
MSYNNQYGNQYSSQYAAPDGPDSTVHYHGSPHAQDQHEMQPFVHAQEDPSVLPTSEFLNRVQHTRTEIRRLGDEVQQLAGLHQRALANADSSASSPERQQLDYLAAATQQRSGEVRELIRALRADAEHTQDAGAFKIKRGQVESLGADFRTELRRQLDEENRYRDACRGQITRQFRIVNPDATDDEVRAAADRDWDNEGVFQAALRTNRSAEATAVLGAVRARHTELVNIERTIRELMQLFQDLDTLVVQQSATIVQVAEQAHRANDDLEKGAEHVRGATGIVRHTRKLKWWCLLVVVLIILIIALAVGLAVGLRKATS